MTAFTARVPYATFSERLECDLIAPGVVELTEFSDFLPLGPGDRVLVDDDGVVIAIDELREWFIVEAFFDLSTSADGVRAQAAAWGFATSAQPETLTAFVGSESYPWIDDVVAGADGVDHVRLVRSPGETLDLAALIEAENADQQD